MLDGGTIKRFVPKKLCAFEKERVWSVKNKQNNWYNNIPMCSR